MWKKDRGIVKREYFCIGAQDNLRLWKRKGKSLLILREEIVPGRGNSRSEGLGAACLYGINHWFSVIGMKGKCVLFREKGARHRHFFCSRKVFLYCKFSIIESRGLPEERENSFPNHV